MIQDIYNSRPIISRIMIYQTPPYSATLNDPYTPDFKGISQMVRDTSYRRSFSGVL